MLRSEGIELLFGTEVTKDEFLEIDKTSATVKVLGPLSSPYVAGLAYDAPSGILYATDTATKNLVTVNPFNGLVKVIGNTGLNLPHGAAIDPSDGTLYAVADKPGRLYRVDKATATATLVGNLGVDHINALDFDPATGVLYAAYAWSDASGFLYTVNTGTGAATLVAPTHRINGLSFDSDGKLYASENGLQTGVPSSLYSIDKSNGNWKLIGSLGVDNVLGLEFGSPALYVDVDKLSAKAGGVAMFTLAAGQNHANRNFILLGSVTGTSPGILLPGGLETLPLTWDFYTQIAIQFANGPNFINFMSKLDKDGVSPATFILPANTPASGFTMYYAYALNNHHVLRLCPEQALGFRLERRVD
jgi:hypothetical protein